MYDPDDASRWMSCPVAEVNTALSEKPAVLSAREANFCDPVTRSNVKASPFSKTSALELPEGYRNAFAQLRW